MANHVDGLEVLANNCSSRDCPTIYRKDEETLVVQGYEADQLFSTSLPEGEHAVSIPVALLKELDPSLFE